MGFSEKNLVFSKSLKVTILLQKAYETLVFLRNVFSVLVLSFFLQKNQIFKVGKIRNYDEERVYFQKKTLSSIQKPSLQKWEGGKYTSGGRPSC